MYKLQQVHNLEIYLNKPIPKVEFIKDKNLWVINGFKEAQEVLTNYSVFSSTISRSTDHILLGADPPIHSYNRGIFSNHDGLFSSDYLHGISGQIETICNDLFSQLASKETFDLSSEFAVPYSSKVMFLLLGIDYDDDNIVNWTNNAVLNKSINNLNYSISEWEKVKPVIKQLLSDTRLSIKKNGIIEILNYRRVKECFSEDDIYTLIKVLLIGGNETTPNLITSATYQLLTNPELNGTISKEPDFVKKLINETLRFYTPTLAVNRITMKDAEINGHVIPANSMVYVNIAAANRDPEYFIEPNKFSINRKESKHLSFGYGPHYCLGSHLSKMEAEIAIKNILNILPDFEIAEGFQKIYKNSSYVRGIKYFVLNNKSKKQKFNLHSFKEHLIKRVQDTINTFNYFPTYEYYPHFELKKHLGWHITYPSPFIHSNVLYSLLNSENKDLITLVKKGAGFLNKHKENGDLWRFWKIDECEHPVPPDLDDTALVSTILKKLGYFLNNTQIIQNNILQNRNINTWVKANYKLLFTNPIIYLSLKQSEKKIQGTLKSGMFSWSDNELGVEANVLMYLGENESTKGTINKCITEWKSDSFNHQFYDKKVVVAYHIARAYKEGIKSFEVLKNDILNYLESEIDFFCITELLYAYLINEYFKETNFLQRNIKERIINELLLNSNVVFEYYPYFTSKDRVFYAGSDVYTVALFLEASKHWK